MSKQDSYTDFLAAKAQVTESVGRMTRTPVSVTVLHTCVIDGTPTDHEAPVEVHEIGRVTLGLRYRGVRCDGSAIEWVEP